MNASGAVPFVHDNYLSARVLGSLGGSESAIYKLQHLLYNMPDSARICNTFNAIYEFA